MLYGDSACGIDGIGGTQTVWNCAQPLIQSFTAGQTALAVGQSTYVSYITQERHSEVGSVASSLGNALGGPVHSPFPETRHTYTATQAGVDAVPQRVHALRTGDRDGGDHRSMKGARHVRSSVAAFVPRRVKDLAAEAERIACVLLVLACACLAACRNEQAGRAGGDAGSVPQAVMEHGVLLLNGSIPEHLAVSASAGGDYEVTPAARANGVEASFAVSWSGVERMSDGRAEDVSGSFTALKLASDAWQLFAGAGEVLDTLCNSDGTFATKGDDYSGVYVGRTESGNYHSIRMDLQRDGTTHTGTLRYTNPVGDVQTFRILGFHRVAAEDAAVQHMDGQIEFWAQEAGSSHHRPQSLPKDALEVRGAVFALGWLPPQQRVAVTLRREDG
ncbi:MAG: hypothetical protein ABI779_15875 [Acidobacteriota bacterium]